MIVTENILIVLDPRPMLVIDVVAGARQLGPDWIVYNAPRPMHGHARWVGPFRHGTLYGAIDLSDDAAPLHVASLWRRSNLRDDGWVLEFRDRATELEAHRAELLAAYPDVATEITDADAAELLASWQANGKDRYTRQVEV